MENKVKDLRDKIDEIDLKILDLIQSRAIHASKIGEIKKESPDFNGIFYKPEREKEIIDRLTKKNSCLLYTSPSPRDLRKSRMPSSA